MKARPTIKLEHPGCPKCRMNLIKVKRKIHTNAGRSRAHQTGWACFACQFIVQLNYLASDWRQVHQ